MYGRFGAAAVLALLPIVSPAAAQTTLPPLPRLALDVYPASARDAVSRAHRRASARSTDPDAVGALGRMLHAWERWSAAHEAYARSQVLAPRVFEWHYLDAVVLQRLARHDEAARRLREALAVSPGYLPARLKLAEALLETGELEEARPLFEVLTGEPACEPAAHLGLGRIEAAEGRHDAAIPHLQHALALVPEFGAAHEAALARDPSFAQAHANLITLYGRARNWIKAEEHYRAVVALGVNLGDAHYDYGVLLGLQEKWDRAAEAYQQALAVNPQHAEAHNNLGQTLEREQNFDAAAAAYRHAVDSQPAFRLARFNLGRVLLALGRAQEAIVELEKLTQPRDAEAPRYLFALASAYVRSGDKDRGITWATEARRLALEHGQHDLAAAIERDLARLK
ncbi:MAG: tetratricopeptide repeat protein [Acidobacteria bacterium]|nr:tetratricopeptide repeat protein [Acidobacteriota bacterium]